MRVQSDEAAWLDEDMSAVLDRLLPLPVSVTEHGGELPLGSGLAVAGPPGVAELVDSLLGEGFGLQVLPAAAAGDGAVRLSVSEGDHPRGGYRLHVSEHDIEIDHADPEGLVNAVQTLKQLLPDHVYGRGSLPTHVMSLPTVTIVDAPALAWRGVHLDVARHFQPLSFLYDFVDALAMHKINIFHLHLTEDQGWRFEVRKYPRLTEIGAWRTGTRFPDWEASDDVPHGGYYTQDQLRALNHYAKLRGVTIVPEIDLPGHSVALLAAHPEFGEPGHEPAGVATTFGIFNEVLHLDAATMTMVTDVLTELLDVFDSPWIHIGGDECPRDQWRNSPRAAALAEAYGLESVEYLQQWFTEQLRTWLAERGRTLVGWDEIIDEAEVPGAVVMSWRGVEPGLRALAAGHQVIMAPTGPLYLDFYQADGADEPRSIGGLNTWQDIAAYDPYAGIGEDQRAGLIGIQAQLWSEYLVDARRVEYAAFPRVSVMAEVAWRGVPVHPETFEPRLAAQLDRLAVRGVNFRPLTGPRPWQVGGGRYRRTGTEFGGEPDGH